MHALKTKSSISIITALIGLYGLQAMENQSNIEKPKLMLKVKRDTQDNNSISLKRPRVEPKISTILKFKKPQQNFLNYVQFGGFPNDVLSLIFSYCNTNKINLSVCHLWNQIIENKYQILNTSDRYVAFSNSNFPSSHRMIYMTNHYLKKYMAIFRNINLNISDNYNRVIFEKLYAFFEKLAKQKNKKDTPFFDKESHLIQFVNLLKYHADGHNPTKFHEGQTKGNKSKATKIKHNLLNSLASACITNYPNAQNDIILFHYIKTFIDETNNIFDNEPTSSLADTIKNNGILTSLRNNIRNNIALKPQQWEQLIDLDQGATIQDFRGAAMSHKNANNFHKAILYQQQVILKAGNVATTQDFRTLAGAQAGLFKTLHTAGSINESITHLKESITSAQKVAQRNDATTQDFRYMAGGQKLLFDTLHKAGSINESITYLKEAITSEQKVVQRNDATTQDFRYMAAGQKLLFDTLHKAGSINESITHLKEAITSEQKVVQRNDATTQDFKKLANVQFGLSQILHKAGLVDDAFLYHSEIIETLTRIRERNDATNDDKSKLENAISALNQWNEEQKLSDK